MHFTLFPSEIPFKFIYNLLFIFYFLFITEKFACVVGVIRKEVLERRELTKKTNLRVFNAMAVPTLLYGCETWTVKRRHESKLQVFEMTTIYVSYLHFYIQSNWYCKFVPQLY